MRREGKKGKLPTNRSVNNGYTEYITLADLRQHSDYGKPDILSEKYVPVIVNKPHRRIILNNRSLWKIEPPPTRTEKRTIFRVRTTPAAAGSAGANIRRIRAKECVVKRRREKKSNKLKLMQLANCE